MALITTQTMKAPFDAVTAGGIHFTWTAKPWHYGCTHPAVREFFAAVDRTDWRGWRPAAPAELSARLANTYKQYRAWYRRTVAPVTRSLKESVQGKKRAA